MYLRQLPLRPIGFIPAAWFSSFTIAVYIDSVALQEDLFTGFYQGILGCFHNFPYAVCRAARELHRFELRRYKVWFLTFHSDIWITPAGDLMQ